MCMRVPLRAFVAFFAAVLVTGVLNSSDICNHYIFHKIVGILLGPCNCAIAIQNVLRATSRHICELPTSETIGLGDVRQVLQLW